MRNWPLDASARPFRNQVAFRPRTSLMSLLRFGSGRKRTETDALKAEVSALRAALVQCQIKVRHWTSMGVSLIAVIAAVGMALGFLLGIYKEPIVQTMTGWVPGLAQPDAVAACTAYEKGRYATALQLARPLAEQGDARAQSIIGLMYAKGQGVPQDPGEAAKWYHLAADQSDAEAQYGLAFLYATGDGVAQDYVAAHMWFNLASARLPVSDARRRLAIANRDAMETKMTREQIAEARQRAREWTTK